MHGSNVGLFASAFSIAAVSILAEPMGLSVAGREFAVETLQWLVLTFAGVSGTGYGIRSVEKHRGKA